MIYSFNIIQPAAMRDGVNIFLYSCVQDLIQDLNFGGDMNVSSFRNIMNVKNYCCQIDRLASVSRQICFALKDEFFIGTVQNFLNTNFRIRIAPFLSKILVFNCFWQCKQAKEIKFGHQPFCVPKQKPLSFLGCIRP